MGASIAATPPYECATIVTADSSTADRLYISEIVDMASFKNSAWGSNKRKEENTA